jgi:hypothetical protein
MNVPMPFFSFTLKRSMVLKSADTKVQKRCKLQLNGMIIPRFCTFAK